MKTRPNAFTVLELMVVILCVTVLGALLLPALRRAKEKGQRITCTSNLKQIGAGARLWSGDHHDRMPMRFYTNNAGGSKYADAASGFNYFLVMSNELSTPLVLRCPSDSGRTTATSFAQGIGNVNLSYFIGLDADESNPSLFLAGDRHITNGTPVKNGVLTLSTNTPTGWTMEIHHGAGNIGMTDGSVQGLTSPLLNSAVAGSGTNAMRLLMP